MNLKFANIVLFTALAIGSTVVNSEQAQPQLMDTSSTDPSLNLDLGLNKTGYIATKIQMKDNQNTEKAVTLALKVDDQGKIHARVIVPETKSLEDGRLMVNMNENGKANVTVGVVVHNHDEQKKDADKQKTNHDDDEKKLVRLELKTQNDGTVKVAILDVEEEQGESSSNNGCHGSSCKEPGQDTISTPSCKGPDCKKSDQNTTSPPSCEGPDCKKSDQTTTSPPSCEGPDCKKSDQTTTSPPYCEGPDCKKPDQPDLPSGNPTPNPLPGLSGPENSSGHYQPTVSPFYGYGRQEQEQRPYYPPYGVIVQDDKSIKICEKRLQEVCKFFSCQMFYVYVQCVGSDCKIVPEGTCDNVTDGQKGKHDQVGKNCPRKCEGEGCMSRCGPSNEENKKPDNQKNDQDKPGSQVKIQPANADANPAYQKKAPESRGMVSKTVNYCLIGLAMFMALNAL